MYIPLNLSEVEQLQRFASQYFCLQDLYHLLNLRNEHLYGSIMDPYGSFELHNL